MKIGIIYSNKGKFKGGADRRYFNLIKHLSNKHYLFLCVNKSVELYWNELGGFNDNVNIFCLEDDSIDKRIINIDNNIINKKDSVGLKKLFSQLIWLVKNNYKTYKWSKKYDIKLINAVQAAGILSLGPELRGAKIIFSYTDYMVENGYPFKFIYNHGLKTVVRISDKYDFLSEIIPNRMIQKGLVLNKNKINCANTSFIDHTYFYPSPVKKNKIVFSGRLEEIKNPFLVLKIAEKICFVKSDFQIKILGDGPLKNNLLEARNKMKLNDVIEIKYLNNIYEELNDALIYLSVQKENNFPSQALIEALFSGCIPIVTDVGESRLMIKRDFGFLVDSNEDTISQIIIDILNNKEKYIPYGNQARNYALANFTVDNYLKYYESLLFT